MAARLRKKCLIQFFYFRFCIFMLFMAEYSLGTWQQPEPGRQWIVRSCPARLWSSDVVVALFDRAGRVRQAAMVGSLTRASSPMGAMAFDPT
jgi:hypothetical protein